MAITLGSSGVVFPDGTTQTEKFDTTDDVGALYTINQYNASGTWTKSAGVRQLRVIVVGGGGGGCGHAESGGAGGFAEKWIDVSGWATGQTITVTCGGAGDGRTYHQGCGDGGTSSFGPYVSASGGYGANRNWGHSGGHGGIGSGGDINLWGGGGSGHENEGSGKGGASYFGGGGLSTHHNWRSYSTEGSNHNAPGSGGTGTWTSHERGAYGCVGSVVVYNYK